MEAATANVHIRVEARCCRLPPPTGLQHPCRWSPCLSPAVLYS